MPNVLFIYAGSRRTLEKSYNQGKAPDTSFFGMNHLQDFGYHADFLEPADIIGPKYARTVQKYLGFNVPFLVLISKAKKYDVVISSGAFGVLFLLSLFKIRRPQWFIFNINLTNLLQRNQNKKFRGGFLRRTLLMTDKIICLSRAQMLFLKQQGIPEEKLVFVKFGVAKDFFKSTPEHQNYILSVGRDNGRDYATLIEAVRTIKNKVIIVASKRNLVGINSIPSNVQILYDVDYEQLRTLYAGAQLVVVPSKKETYLDASDCSGQTVILDAMASGKAVIASKRTWMDDYLVDGQDFYCISPEDPAALAEKIKSVLAHPDELLKIGRNARYCIETTLNNETMAKAIAETIDTSIYSCPICGTTKVNEAYHIEGFTYLKCTICGLFIMKDQEKIDLNALYGESYYTQEYKSQDSTFNYFADKEKKIKAFKTQLNELKPYLSDDARILDVGCAAGYFLAAAREEGYDVSGVEVSPEAVAFARNELRLNIISNDLMNLSLDYDQQFDAITLFQTLEHVSNLREYITKLYALLKPGGVLYIEVPNGSTVDVHLSKTIFHQVFQPPHHVYVFNQFNIKKLVESAGFIVIDQRAYISTVLREAVLKLFRRKPAQTAQKNTSAVSLEKAPTHKNNLRLKDGVKDIVRHVLPGANMRIICKKPN